MTRRKIRIFFIICLAPRLPLRWCWVVCLSEILEKLWKKLCLLKYTTNYFDVKQIQRYLKGWSQFRHYESVNFSRVHQLPRAIVFAVDLSSCFNFNSNMNKELQILVIGNGACVAVQYRSIAFAVFLLCGHFSSPCFLRIVTQQL